MSGDAGANDRGTGRSADPAGDVATPSQRAALAITAGWLILRPWRLDDIVFVYEACQDAEIQRWTTVPRPYRAGQATGFVTMARQAVLDGTEYHLCIADADREETIGAIGVKAPCGGDAEIGYWIAPEGRGRGAASTALEGLTHWCFTALNLSTVHLRIAPGNAGSLAVAKRCRFEIVDRQTGACHDGDAITDALVLRRDRP